MRHRFAPVVVAAAALAAAALGDLHAATIVNTAKLRYDAGGQTRTVDSNTVTLSTTRPPTPGKVIFLRYTPDGPDPKPTDATGGLCRNSNGVFAPVAMGGGTGSMDLAAAPLRQTSAFRAGEVIFIQLADGNRNLDPASREIIEVRVTTSTNDEEVLRMRETAADSAVFLAPIQTVAIPPAAAKFDCQLSVGTNTDIKASYVDDFYPSDISVAEALVDPYGFVFSTEDGAPIDGVSVTLIDEATGQPAAAFGDDGLVEPYPNVVTTGGSVTTNIRSYQFPPGGFRFPLLRTGSYRLRVVPPEAFRSPSAIGPDLLRLLVGPDGKAFTLDPVGSYGGPFEVIGPAPIKIDLPMDPLRGTLVMGKNASTGVASIGDFVRYEVSLTNRNRVVEQRNTIVTDALPTGFRYRAGSLRIDDAPAADPQISADGRTLTIPLGTLPAGASRKMSYVTQVGPATPLGEAVNAAQARAEGGLSTSNRATIGVRISSGFFNDAVTIVGRVVEGQCGVDPKSRPGVEGIRVLMEDGTFVVSDEDGQFHFEGVRPGTHVVQLDLATLPEGYEVVECVRNTRTAGRAFSQFVEAQGGSLWRTDFFLRRKPGAPPAKLPAAPAGEPGAAVDQGKSGAATEPTAAVQPAASDEAAGDVDWLEDQTPGAGLLFPKPDYNPRAPVTRVVLKHAPGQRVKLHVNGKPADALSFDGIETSLDKKVAISSWRALPLVDGENLIRAEVDGEVFESRIYYSNTATRATFVPERSKLVADGVTRPIVAVRITDKTGKPVRAGLSGGFSVRPPYFPATEVDMQQERQLAGLDRFDATWHVAGDDGIALIELQPTTQTGTAELEFEFDYDKQKRRDEIRAWLQPASRDWVVVGFAAGTVGFNTLSKNSEKLADTANDETFKDGQATFYAKGRVKGQWVLTLAYDSERTKKGLDGRRSLLRVIDPGRYYTVYGDRSAQGYDAASAEKLYLRLERPQFYALFGDYDTGLTGSELGAYSRTFTGAKAEYRGEKLAATAFIADTDLNYQRDEIQGNGLSGPYPLSRRDLILNTEKVRIEIRDRFRSERIVETKFLSRHIDYDIDYDAGTLLFRQPILSRDRQFNPIFIVAEYETEGAALTYTNAGARVLVEPVKGKLQIGATAVRDSNALGKTDLGAVDVRVRPTDRTEVRLEAALTDSRRAGSNEAYIAEVEHRGEKVDAVVYYREQDASFGVGQQNRSEGGTRKYGVDGRVELAKNLDATASVYREEYMNSTAKRDAASATVEYRNGDSALRAGVTHAADENQVGEELTSTLLQVGASQSLMGGKLQLTGDADLGIGSGGEQSVDFPARYRLGASYAISEAVRLVARHEITDGADFDSATTQFGFAVAPWAGARLTSTLNQQAIGENGQRSFANLGLTQSLLLGTRWGVDFSVDSSQTFDGRLDPDDVLNPNFPVAPGGFLSRNGLTDDFVAFSTGATYRSDLWSWNGRLEYRNADSGDQYGLSTSLLRQIENGVTVSASARAFRFDQDDGSTNTSVTTDVSLAWRPLGSRWSILEKLEVRMDKVEDGVAGGYSPFGASGLIVSGDAKSWRVVNNIALNRVAGSWKDENLEQRSQFSLFYGSKYVLSRFDSLDFKGYTHMLGLEARLDLTSWLDLGMSASVRHAFQTDDVAFSVGPSIGISPLANAWISVGYNIVGYRDRDFEDARYTREGFYIMMRIKLDQQTPQDLGLTGDKKS